MSFGESFEGLPRSGRRAWLGVLLMAWTLGWLVYIAYQGLTAAGGTR